MTKYYFLYIFFVVYDLDHKAVLDE